MAKIVDFRPGFAELRGNISGKQNLKYAENDNKAFESPIGKRNYARNYKPSVVVSRRASDGRYIFGVRTKSAVGMTTSSQKAMAVLGGLGSMIASILRSKSSATYTTLIAIRESLPASAKGASLRAWLTQYLRPMFENKVSSIVLAGPAGSITINNPFCRPGATQGAEVSADTLTRFWEVLSLSGLVFNLDGQKGICFDGETFENLIDSGHNTLALTTQSISAAVYVKQGSNYLQKSVEGVMQYVTDEDEIVAGDYFLTSIAPQ